MRSAEASPKNNGVTVRPRKRYARPAVALKLRSTNTTSSRASPFTSPATMARTSGTSAALRAGSADTKDTMDDTDRGIVVVAPPLTALATVAATLAPEIRYACVELEVAFRATTRTSSFPSPFQSRTCASKSSTVNVSTGRPITSVASTSAAPRVRVEARLKTDFPRKIDFPKMKLTATCVSEGRVTKTRSAIPSPSMSPMRDAGRPTAEAITKSA